MSSTNSKDKNNPSKRIEYRGENVRVSRTGGVSATKTFKGDGVGATINTNHGLRLHKRLFKGACTLPNHHIHPIDVLPPDLPDKPPLN